MQEFTTLNGYHVKDETARNSINDLSVNLNNTINEIIQIFNCSFNVSFIFSIYKVAWNYVIV